MLRVELLNATDLAEKFDTLLEALDDLPVHTESELKAWQLSDMNRAQPIAYMPDSVSVETTIWPRQYRQKQRAIRRGGLLGGIRRRGRVVSRAPKRRMAVVTTRRPIVRPELMDMLVDRMYAMRDRIVKWPRGRL